MSVKLKNAISGEVQTFPFIYAEKILRVCDSLKKKPFVLDDKKFKYEGGQLFRVKPDISEIAKDLEADASTRGDDKEPIDEGPENE